MKWTIVGGVLAGCALLLAAVGCGAACKCCRTTTDAPAAAPERVEIDGCEYTLTANAWRDFQPVAPPNGQPLAVAVWVNVTGSLSSMPQGAFIDRVWVLNGKEQWSAEPERPSERGLTMSLSAVIRGGPKWGPGIAVDVVVRLKQGKQTWFVRAAGVPIKRTD